MEAIYGQSVGISERITNCMANIRKDQLGYSNPNIARALKTQIRLFSKLRVVQGDNTLGSESGRLIAEIGKSLNGDF